jgi:hypothetical protein
MRHHASPAFWQAYAALPEPVRETADKSFALLKQDSEHPSLHLKKVGVHWSVRVGRRYRALAVQVDDGLLWFWIGNHAEYDRMIRG